MTTDAPTLAKTPLADLAARRTGTATTHAAVIGIIERFGTGLSAREISEYLDIPVATARRYANDLRDAGYLGTGITSTNAAAYYRTDAKDPSA